MILDFSHMRTKYLYKIIVTCGVGEIEPDTKKALIVKKRDKSFYKKLIISPLISIALADSNPNQG